MIYIHIYILDIYIYSMNILYIVWIYRICLYDFLGLAKGKRGFRFLHWPEAERDAGEGSMDGRISRLKRDCCGVSFCSWFCRRKRVHKFTLWHNRRTHQGTVAALLLTLLQSVLQNWNLLHLVRELQFWRTVRSSTSSCPRWRGLHWAGSRQGAGREPMVQDAQIRNWKDSVRMCETWNRPFAFPLDLE